MAPMPLDPRHPHVSRLNPLERPEPRRWRRSQRIAMAGDDRPGPPEAR
jgi:hypothetical protein